MDSRFSGGYSKPVGPIGIEEFIIRQSHIDEYLKYLEIGRLVDRKLLLLIREPNHQSNNTLARLVVVIRQQQTHVKSENIWQLYEDKLKSLTLARRLLKNSEQ